MRPMHREQQEDGAMRQSSPSRGAAFSPTRRVGARGGPQLFAQKLFTLVEEENPEIVEWLPDGLAFRVKDIQRFSNEILEKYFNHSKFTSFQRQLNLYQFKRRKGAHAGAFHHPSFRRGQRHLLSKVRRQKVKRDLAVEARAAQRLARSREARREHRIPEQSDRGRTRAATQADIRPVRQHQGEGDLSSEEHAPGSRRNALRRRVDASPSTRDIGVMDNEGDEGSSNGDGDTWPTVNVGMERIVSHAGRGWGEDWRAQVPGSPERSPQQLQHVLTPVTSQSSDCEYSPRSSLDRISSVGSSLGSSSSLASSPSHSDMFHASPYHVEGSSSDCSISSPVERAVAAVQAAQVCQPDHGLSLAAVIDASIGGWNSPHQMSSLRPFESLGWGSALGEAAATSSIPILPDASPSTASHQHQSQPSQHEDFGFIDLFATNWDSPSEGAFSSLDSATTADGKTESFMKEAEAAGVFGVEDLAMPRGSGGAYSGPTEYA